MILAELLYKTGILETAGNTQKEVSKVVFDSRQAEPGALYVAIPGHTFDGHDYIDEAIARGAGSILCERFPEEIPAGPSFARVEDSRKALATVAANLYKHPSRRLKLIGVTGTNGKTTVCSLLYEVFTPSDTNAG